MIWFNVICYLPPPILPIFKKSKSFVLKSLFHNRQRIVFIVILKLPIYSINKICCPRILMKLPINYIIFVAEIFCPPLTVSASTIMNLSTGVSKTNSMDISVNTSATFSCKPGFRLNDSSSLLCQIDGTWNGTLPSCSGTLK